MVSARFYVLSGGELHVDKGFMTLLHDVGQTCVIPIWQAYIDHPDAKIIWESGFDPSNTVREFPLKPPYFKQSPEETLEAQLRLIGVKPDDIDFVIPSHLHSDHTGYLRIFARKKAKVLVQWSELRYAYVPEPFSKNIYHRAEFDIPDLNYECIEGHYRVAEGVEIFPTPGHSPGHQSLIVRLERTGPLILTGDAVYLKETLETLALPGTCTSPIDAVRSIEKIKQIASIEKGTIFYSHYLEQFRMMKKAPQYYE